MWHITYCIRINRRTWLISMLCSIRRPDLWDENRGNFPELFLGTRKVPLSIDNIIKISNVVTSKIRDKVGYLHFTRDRPLKSGTVPRNWGHLVTLVLQVGRENSPPSKVGIEKKTLRTTGVNQVSFTPHDFLKHFCFVSESRNINQTCMSQSVQLIS